MDEIWSRQETIELINLYRNSTCLWDPMDPNFTSKSKRSTSLSEICTTLQKTKKNLTVSAIKTKLRTLQSQLSRERGKINTSKRSGTSTDNLYKPSLWCYDELSFLMYCNDAESSSSNINQELIGLAEKSKEEIESRQNMNKKKRKESYSQQLHKEALELIRSSNQHAPKPTTRVESKEETFCHYLCSELKRLKLEASFIHLKNKILEMVGDKILEEEFFFERQENQAVYDTYSPLPSSSPEPFLYQSHSLSDTPPEPFVYQSSHTPIETNLLSRSSSPSTLNLSLSSYPSLTYQKPLPSLPYHATSSSLPNTTPLTFHSSLTSTSHSIFYPPSRSPLPSSSNSNLTSRSVSPPICSQRKPQFKIKQESNIKQLININKNSNKKIAISKAESSVAPSSFKIFNTSLPVSVSKISSPILLDQPKKIHIIKTEIVKPPYDLLQMAMNNLYDEEDENDDQNLM